MVDIDSLEELKKKMKNGIEYLDKSFPDWIEKIDVDKLKMSDPCSCVLGQLFGGFWNLSKHWCPGGWGREEFCFWAGERGFWAGERGFSVGTVYEYQILTKLWRDEIIKRKEEKCLTQ